MRAVMIAPASHRQAIRQAAPSFLGRGRLLHRMKPDHIALTVADDRDKAPFADRLFGHKHLGAQISGAGHRTGDIVTGKINKAAFLIGPPHRMAHQRAANAGMNCGNKDR